MGRRVKRGCFAHHLIWYQITLCDACWNGQCCIWRGAAVGSTVVSLRLSAYNSNMDVFVLPLIQEHSNSCIKRILAFAWSLTHLQTAQSRWSCSTLHNVDCHGTLPCGKILAEIDSLHMRLLDCLARVSITIIWDIDIAPCGDFLYNVHCCHSSEA